MSSVSRPRRLLRRALPTESARVIALCCCDADASPTVRAQSATVFTAFAAAMNFDLSRQWIIETIGASENEGTTRAAAMLIPAGGGLAHLMISPELASMSDEPVATELWHEIRNAATDAGRHSLQIVSDCHKSAIEPLMSRWGLQYLTRLHYLECDTEAPSVGTNLPSDGRFTWHTFRESESADWKQIIGISYQGSLDCPELTTVRSADDALDAHRTTGRFHPERWMLLKRDNAPCGCILLNEMPLRSALEVVYMGVAPEFRGQRIGFALVCKALQIARNDGFAQLSLAVDARNAPARRIYDAHGFAERLQRDAWLRARL